MPHCTLDLFYKFSVSTLYSFLELSSVFTHVNCYVCSVNNGKLTLEDIVLTKSILENTKCFLLDCGSELYVWVGRVTQVDDRKAASVAVEVNAQDIILSLLSCSNKSSYLYI